jgi:hypothetical protein
MTGVRPFPPLAGVLGIFSNVGFTDALPKSSFGLGLFDVCPQRRRPVLTHMGVRADVE